MKNLVRFIIIVSMLVLVSGCGLRTVDTNEIGIVINKFTGKIEKIGVGTHFLPGVVYDFYALSTKIDKRELELLFKTKDGNDVKQKITTNHYLDATDPVKIITQLALSNKDLEDLFLLTTIRSRGREVLGDSHTMEYINTAFRSNLQDQGSIQCNSLLNPMGLRIQTFNLGDYDFANKAYRDLINERKKYDQDREAVIKKIEETKQKILANLKSAEGENNKIRATADGEFRQAKNKADANLSKARDVGQAIKREGENEYEFLTEKMRSMQGSGGKNLVRIELSKMLGPIEKVFVPSEKAGAVGLRTTDMNDLFKMIGLGTIAKKDILKQSGTKKEESVTPGQEQAAAPPEPTEAPRHNPKGR